MVVWVVVYVVIGWLLRGWGFGVVDLGFCFVVCFVVCGWVIVCVGVYVLVGVLLLSWVIVCLLPVLGLGGLVG